MADLKPHLQRLSDRELVEFATIAAEKVAPLFVEAWPSASPSRLSQVQEALDKAKGTLQGAVTDPRAAMIAALVAREAVMAAEWYCHRLQSTNSAAPDAALAASSAALAAAHFLGESREHLELSTSVALRSAILAADSDVFAEAIHEFVQKVTTTGQSAGEDVSAEFRRVLVETDVKLPEQDPASFSPSTIGRDVQYSDENWAYKLSAEEIQAESGWMHFPEQGLTRWAMVAYAARALRRLEDIMKDDWPSALGTVVEYAERAAENATTLADEPKAAKVVLADEALPTTEALTNCVTEGPEKLSLLVSIVDNHAAIAITRTIKSEQVPQKLLLACRRDVLNLQWLTSQLNWTDETPVSPSVFGPLWPDGLPTPTTASSGCFISTACYGYPHHPDVELLRVWRDRVAKRYASGRLLCKLYAQISPLLAARIARNRLLRSIVRRFLVVPAVFLIRVSCRTDSAPSRRVRGSATGGRCVK